MCLDHGPHIPPGLWIQHGQWRSTVTPTDSRRGVGVSQSRRCEICQLSRRLENGKRVARESTADRPTTRERFPTRKTCGAVNGWGRGRLAEPRPGVWPGHDGAQTVGVFRHGPGGVESAAERRGAAPGGNTGEARERRRKLPVFKSCAFTWWQMGLLTRSWLASGICVGSIWPGGFGSGRGLLTVFFVVPAFYVRYVWLTQL